MKIFLSILFTFSLLNAADINYEKSKNVVTDHTHKLIWQDNIEVTQYLESLTTAKVYCKTMVLNGYIDWRVPTIKEIQKIVDVNNKSSIDKRFKFVKPNIYITNTFFTLDDKYIWVVDFKNGKTTTQKQIDENYIRCVRDIK